MINSPDTRFNLSRPPFPCSLGRDPELSPDLLEEVFCSHRPKIVSEIFVIKTLPLKANNGVGRNREVLPSWLLRMPGTTRTASPLNHANLIPQALLNWPRLLLGSIASISLNTIPLNGLPSFFVTLVGWTEQQHQAELRMRSLVQNHFPRYSKAIALTPSRASWDSIEEM